jgi:hypothetical protein
MCNEYDRWSPTPKVLHRGEWKGLWETTFRFVSRETNNKSNQHRDDTRHKQGSIQALVTYTEYYPRLGALSKAKQTVTSNLTPNSDPVNLRLNPRTKHPDPVHTNCDPTLVSSILWMHPHKLQEYFGI